MGAMDTLLRYRGRLIGADEVAYLNELIAQHPQATRRVLSLKVCTDWGWRQANGALQDAVCRSLMLELHRAGHITLPPPTRVFDPTRRPRSTGAEVVIDDQPITASLNALKPLELRQVRRTPDEPLFTALLTRHHYLGYTQPVGEHLKFIFFAQDRPVGCFAWSSAPRHLAPRDRFLGWPPEIRKQNLQGVVYNSRFLIPPWVRVPHLASHLLGWMARVLPAERTRVYGHPVYFAETFVDPERYAGTCYYAANWQYLGQTTGRGKNSDSKRPNRSLKDVLGLPLVRDFRQRLGIV